MENEPYVPQKRNFAEGFYRLNAMSISGVEALKELVAPTLSEETHRLLHPTD